MIKQFNAVIKLEREYRCQAWIRHTVTLTMGTSTFSMSTTTSTVRVPGLAVNVARFIQTWVTGNTYEVASTVPSFID